MTPLPAPEHSNAENSGAPIQIVPVPAEIGAEAEEELLMEQPRDGPANEDESDASKSLFEDFEMEE